MKKKKRKSSFKLYHFISALNFFFLSLSAQQAKEEPKKEKVEKEKPKKEKAPVEYKYVAPKPGEKKGELRRCEKLKKLRKKKGGILYAKSGSYKLAVISNELQDSSGRKLKCMHATRCGRAAAV